MPQFLLRYFKYKTKPFYSGIIKLPEARGPPLLLIKASPSGAALALRLAILRIDVLHTISGQAIFSFLPVFDVSLCRVYNA